MDRKEKGKRNISTSSFQLPLPYNLACCLVRCFESPHPNFKPYLEAELVGNEPSSPESIA